MLLNKLLRCANLPFCWLPPTSNVRAYLTLFVFFGTLAGAGSLAGWSAHVLTTIPFVEMAHAATH